MERKTGGILKIKIFEILGVFRVFCFASLGKKPISLVIYEKERGRK